MSLNVASSTTQDSHHCSVECSDEETYFEPSESYRSTASGSRIWEPTGDAIGRLYEEIETTGVNKLEWQCPGRISPSQFNLQEPDDGQFTALEEGGSLAGGDQTKSKFDFDDEFDNDNFGSSSNAKVAAKRTQGLFTIFPHFAVHFSV